MTLTLKNCSPFLWTCTLATSNSWWNAYQNRQRCYTPQAGSKCTCTDCSNSERRCACFRWKCFASFFTAVPDTFEELARHLFKRLSNVSMVHFVTYSYKEISIKAQGRLRRGKYNPIKISGSSIKVPRKFQNFLSKDENKRNLLALIRNEWSTQINMLKRSKEHKHKHLLCLWCRLYSVL